MGEGMEGKSSAIVKYKKKLCKICKKQKNSFIIMVNLIE